MNDKFLSIRFQVNGQDIWWSGFLGLLSISWEAMFDWLDASSCVYLDLFFNFGDLAEG